MQILEIGVGAAMRTWREGRGGRAGEDWRGHDIWLVLGADVSCLWTRLCCLAGKVRGLVNMSCRPEACDVDLHPFTCFTFIKPHRSGEPIFEQEAIT